MGSAFPPLPRILTSGMMIVLSYEPFTTINYWFDYFAISIDFLLLQDAN